MGVELGTLHRHLDRLRRRSRGLGFSATSKLPDSTWLSSDTHHSHDTASHAPSLGRFGLRWCHLRHHALLHAALLFFLKGLGALQQTVRLLPFILTFILTVVIIAASLPRMKQYGVIYLAGGVITLSSATALATTISPGVPESKVMGLTALVAVGLGLHFQHSNAISNRINKDLRDRVECAALLNMSLMGGISMALIIAGAIYENRGMSLLKSALGSADYPEADLREALAGVSRGTLAGGEAQLMAHGAEATCKAISLLLYIVSPSGALCFTCGVLAVFDHVSVSGSERKKPVK
ncbi:hypothetical protein FPOA_12958 [Fusarium poae]|uniref:Uncharacterized protein n=1 Tax=Fusarium poae TaxID=36050 RepID=A0A1B8A7D4_FUSPO|nr:hypothetical protein FPOA_12958 [Fusarium poae]